MSHFLSSHNQAFTDLITGLCPSRDKSTRITSLALSTSSTHLLIGTSRSALAILDVASQNIIRSLSLLPQGAGAGASKASSSQLSVSSLVPFVAFESPSSPMLSGWDVCSRLARQETSHEDDVVPMRLAQIDVTSLAAQLCPPSLAADPSSMTTTTTGDTAAGTNVAAAERSSAGSEVEKLQRENEELKRLVKRAHAANEAMWTKVVQGAVKGVTATSSSSSS